MLAETDWIGDLDADAACLVVEQWHEVRVRAEAELFVMAAHWADLHAQASPGGALPGMERVRQVGADGTPGVAEFAAMELGALQGMGHVAAQHLVRDALNVRHRHPLLWAKVCSGAVRVWQARKVAQLCASADLDASRAAWVDEQTTPYAGSLPWGRLESLVEIKIVEADPQAAEQRRLAAAMQRFVRTGQSNEHGLKTLVARAEAGEVIFFVAVADRIAQVLALQGDRDPVDVRRSKAIGILANPAMALELLEWGAAHGDGAVPQGGAPSSGAGADTGTADDGTADDGTADDGTADDGTADDEAAAGADARTVGGAAEASGAVDASGSEAGHEQEAAADPVVVSERDVHPSQVDEDETGPEARPCPACAGRGMVADGAAPFVRPSRIDPRRLLPDATLYVHLDQAVLGGERPGAAWCEDVGAMTLAQVVELLGHRRVRVAPVLDLGDRTAVDSYQVPARMAEALHLRSPACASPWGANTSRRKDKDHVMPYRSPDSGGPPGQTRLDNLAPLSRFAHRVKTHGRWRLRQVAPAVYEWRSPHGYRFRVDRGGTASIGRDGARRDPPQGE